MTACAMNALHLSGAIAVAVAGMSLGTRHGDAAIQDHARTELLAFWSMVDDALPDSFC